MFIDKIKYTLTTLVFALFLVILVASCGSPESEVHLAADSTNPEEIVPEILHRISGGACDEIPYDICLVAAFVSSRNLQETGAFEDLREDDGVLHDLSTSDDIADTWYQMRNDSVGKIWTQLDRKASEIDIGLIGDYLMALTEMFLITQEFEKRIQYVPWDWVAQHAQNIFLESIETCIAQTHEAKVRSLEYYMCIELENLVALVYDRGLQYFRTPEFQRSMRQEARDHKKYLTSLIQDALVIE